MKTNELYKIIAKLQRKYGWLMAITKIVAMLFGVLDTYLFIKYESNPEIIILAIFIQVAIVYSLINLHTKLSHISYKELRKILSRLNGSFKVEEDSIVYNETIYNKNNSKTFKCTIFVDDVINANSLISMELLLDELKDNKKLIRKKTKKLR